MSSLESRLLVIEPEPHKNREEDFETTTKLSRLIEIALEDMEQAEQDGVTIDMGHWLVFRYEKQHFWSWWKRSCTACLAGCVMKNTYGADKSHNGVIVRYLGDSSSERRANIGMRMMALDCVRNHDFENAWSYMFQWNEPLTSAIPDFLGGAPKFPSYRTNPEAFKNGLRESITFLKTHGC